MIDRVNVYFRGFLVLFRPSIACIPLKCKDIVGRLTRKVKHLYGDCKRLEI